MFNVMWVSIYVFHLTKIKGMVTNIIGQLTEHRCLFITILGQLTKYSCLLTAFDYHLTRHLYWLISPYVRAHYLTGINIEYNIFTPQLHL